MTNTVRVGIVLLILSQGSVGCGDQRSPIAPSAPATPSVQQPSPQPTGIQPTITAIAPHVGSTQGGAWATIIGGDFQPGATVRLGDATVSAWTHDSTTIWISGTAAHAAGAIDVVVTNPGGLEARLAGAYTYESPDSFDFNGDWVAYAGPEFETDMRFTIRNNLLVSFSCGTSEPSTFASPHVVRGGEFSFIGDDGVAISGRLVSPVNAVGTINMPSCPAARWWGDKNGVAAVSRHAHPDTPSEFHHSRGDERQQVLSVRSGRLSNR
jgi:hypothetical protein